LDQIHRQPALKDLKKRAPDFYDFIINLEKHNHTECRFQLQPIEKTDKMNQTTMVYVRVERRSAAEQPPREVIGVVQDISVQHRAEMEKKQLEAKLARSQKMEALGLLAGGVAHDLNNVLSGIVSYPDMLLMRLPDDSELAKPLGVMRDSGLKAAAIVQDLLTLARRGVISMETLNLNDLVDDYLASPEFHKLQSYHPAVEIKFEKQTSLPGINGSAVHLKKSIMNLVSNAVEALPQGGEVLISTRNRYIEKPLKGYVKINPGDYAILSVEDNGDGINKADLGRIFEPFFTKKKLGRSGTGLGLAVVWGTVEDHHGYINVASRMGKGTQVELFLPATTTEAPTGKREATSQDDFRGKGERILVVDDMETQREINREMLAMLGYSVDTVGSGEEAVEFITTNTVDLVILDMIMEPGIDGLETFIRLKALQSDLKVLIVSGYSETGRVKKAMKLGAKAYLKKPFDIQAIGMAVQGALK
jgi:signal transduction histidine kinase